MRTLFITALFLTAGCITDDGVIKCTSDEITEGCGDDQPSDTGDTGND